jgi:hypothetical protein
MSTSDEGGKQGGVTWSQQRWDIAWAAIKDVALTGTGITLILTQVFSRSPSDILLVTGLALTVPSVAGHAKTLLGSSGPGPSSPPSPPSGPSPSGSSSAEVVPDE